MELNIQMIKEFIEANKESEEVQAYLQGFKGEDVTLDRVQKLVNEDKEFQKWLDSEKDKHFSKSLTTWQERTMPKMLEEELNKKVKAMYPEKDEKDIELEKIKSELESIRNEKTRESLTNKAIRIATEKKIPLDLVDYFISGDLDEQKTVANINKFESVLSGYIQEVVESRLKSDSYVPPNGGDDTETITKKDFQSMSYKDRVDLQTQNPELYKQLTQES